MRTFFSFQKIKEQVVRDQQKIALVVGFILTAALFFNLGKFTVSQTPPDIVIEEPQIVPVEVYDNLKTIQRQFVDMPAESGSVAGEATADDCAGRIKGNIGSSGKIYHVPGGSFYNRTNPEMCFDTEADAQAAGFRKSLR